MGQKPGLESMWKKIATLLMSTCLLASGCSSISLPWSSSAAKSDPTAEALLAEGMRSFNEKKYVRAIDSFTKIKTDHPFSPLLTEAERGQLLGEWNRTESAYPQQSLQQWFEAQAALTPEAIALVL